MENSHLKGLFRYDVGKTDVHRRVHEEITEQLKLYCFICNPADTYSDVRSHLRRHFAHTTLSLQRYAEPDVTETNKHTTAA